jgi:dimethylargininase
LRIALTREVSRAMEHCELSFLPRSEINLKLARAQHQAYEEALVSLGCNVRRLPELPEQPDSVFVEDTAVVLDEVAVITRPGAESRRSEITAMSAVMQEYRTLVILSAPATLDGGDVLHIGRTLYMGLSARSNPEGAKQLAAAVAPFGYRVKTVEPRDCLHLKTAATLVAPGLVLINPAWVDGRVFEDMDLVEVDPAEPHGANAVLVGQRVIYPKSFPRTRERLMGRGLEVLAVDMSETEKAEGGVTCCSLIFRA